MGILSTGSGELTTLTLMLNNLDVRLSDVLALDISWSRLSRGIKFYNENSISKSPLQAFVADIKESLHEKCVDVVTSSHALEPNGQHLEVLLSELFRVTKKKLVLFEPSYELNSEEGKTRMDQLGYIKNIEGAVTKLGGRVIDVIPINCMENPLNPTVCYVIEPSNRHKNSIEKVKFCVPGTSYKLEIEEQFMVSRDTGLVFPILENIAVLKAAAAILATAKC